MKRWLLAGLLLAPLTAGADCLPTTRALEDMSPAELVLSASGQRPVTLAVRVADDPRERAAGFQYICPDTIDDTAIYFVFERSRRPSFHMRNVKAPLDIAFIDDDGVIVDIQRMLPYVVGARHHETYSPPGDVAAALEVHAGYFDEHGISAGDWRRQSLSQ